MSPAVVLRLSALCAAMASGLATPAFAQAPPLVSHADASALASELSGEAAKRNLEELSRHHRMRGSREFRRAADFIVDALRRAGLSDARVEEFPADGQRWYGTQRARPAWDAEFAELWELRRDGEAVVPVRRLASFEAMPLTLAQDSESGQVTTELVDVGPGTSAGDYEGKDVRGKLVLASAQPGDVARLAVARHGASGIVSYAQNQRTAWWGDVDTLVRWGHLDTFAPHKTFAFMISLGEARAFQQRLARGEAVLLRADVRAGQHPGAYSIVTATIAGADPVLARQEIVFSCHLDHPRPGANDNASGCVTILEVARTYAKLIDEGRLSRPARTLRFIWPPEIEGTITYLNARPDIAARIAAAIHLDMVGGGPETKAVFHVTRGPASLPSFVNDVAAAIGAFVNEQTGAFAATGEAAFPLAAPEGGKDALEAALVDFTSGSDHQIYTEGSFRIPAVYLNDWPDRYIHTNFDTPANIDPTKLLRAGFISAATGWVLANLDSRDAGAVLDVIRPLSLERVAMLVRRQPGAHEPATLVRFQLWHEQAVLDSLSSFFEVGAATRQEADEWMRRLEGLVGGRPVPPPAPAGEGALVFTRNAEPKGPMSGFGYGYFDDKWGDRRPRPQLLSARPRWGDGDYAYEALNLVDGLRTVQEIRDLLSAIYGPVPLHAVAEYLQALQHIGVLAAGAVPR
jgi:aminopeptidase YwaD